MSAPNVFQETLVATRTGGLWVETTASIELPPGVGISSVAFTLSSTNLNGSTVTPRLEGSLTGSTWETIPDSTVDFAAIPASNAAKFAGGSDKLFDLTPYKYIRQNVSETGAAADGTVIIATIRSQYNAS